ncbi:hypothetical protein EG329_010770 [Mollisiaceae sp. DMI_Dod_QoI]|nr:hypothetical protein EG329_010770 [Helotiales sp. DMI_Dod_QoI]
MDPSTDSYAKSQIQAFQDALQLKREDRAWKNHIWREFQKKFKGHTFQLAHRTTLRDLRDVLVKHGVPIDTPRRGLSTAQALQIALEKELPKEQEPNQAPPPQKQAPVQLQYQGPPPLRNQAPPLQRIQAPLQPQNQASRSQAPPLQQHQAPPQLQYHPPSYGNPSGYYTQVPPPPQTSWW